VAPFSGLWRVANPSRIPPTWSEDDESLALEAHRPSPVIGSPHWCRRHRRPSIDIDVFDGLTVALVLPVHGTAGGLPGCGPVAGSLVTGWLPPKLPTAADDSHIGFALPPATVDRTSKPPSCPRWLRVYLGFLRWPSHESACCDHQSETSSPRSGGGKWAMHGCDLPSG
jgi:hypothetical protein